jgi:hypothetical protein
VLVLPLGFAEPFKVALLEVSAVAAAVVTAGAESVVNESTDPKAIPSLLEVMAQK